MGRIRSVAAMPPKKNNRNNRNKRGQEEEEEKPVVVATVDEDDVEYDSDGNEIVKAVADLKVDADEATSSSGPGRLSAREIQKLKKRKQKGLLTEDELTQYADVLGVEERYEMLGLLLARSNCQFCASSPKLDRTTPAEPPQCEAWTAYGPPEPWPESHTEPNGRNCDLAPQN